MVQSSAATATTCAETAVAAGREIRALVHGMDPQERARHRTPFLKPRGGYGARYVDAVAEEVGLAHLERLARELGCAIELLVDPAAGVTHRVGQGSHTIWASMDAIDGAVVVDGNPTRHRAYPQDLVTLPSPGGLVTWEVTERPWRRVFTTTGTDLSQ